MGQPIRILHVIGIMNRGGAETMIMNLYRSIDRSKVQFDFVQNSNETAAYDDEILELGGKIYHCPHYNGKNHFEYKKWWEQFFEKHKKEYAAVHGHLGSTAAIYLKVAKKYGVYTIAHSHSSGGIKNIKGLLYNIMSYNTRYIADYFFSCSQVAGKDRFGTKVLHSSNYRVLHNAIDTNLFRYNIEIRNRVREEFNIQQNQLILGHIGRFTREKNHVFVLEIMAELLKRNPSTMLLMIGDGPLRTSIQKRAGELGIEKSVIFTGVRSDVNCLIQGMDVFVFPSLYEGLPVTLIETQTSGLPCIMSNKVPEETIMIPQIMKVLSLDNSVKDWVDEVVRLYSKKRQSYQKEIISKGYDIKTTVQWIENFYLDEKRSR